MTVLVNSKVRVLCNLAESRKNVAYKAKAGLETMTICLVMEGHSGGGSRFAWPVMERPGLKNFSRALLLEPELGLCGLHTLTSSR
jgi:hypothetical protein